jgi:hypothetical protein
MSRDLVDRRRHASHSRSESSFGDDDEPDSTDQLRLALRLALDLPRPSGSPELTDHEAAIALIDAAVARLSRQDLPTSRKASDRRRKRLRPPTEAPTASTRFGAQLYPERNLRGYFYREVLAMPLSEVARRLGLNSPQSAAKATRSGAKLARAFARTKTDPRRETRIDRPHGKNERPW